MSSSTVSTSTNNAEQQRLAAADSGGEPWRRWGPYVSERAWGTVREDYSAGGDAWDYFPYDHARSRAYRWNEDGMAGLCDLEQILCFSLALWNGVDSHLKERFFGLTNSQGNHGEDVKEYWWYVDSTPSHSWMRWRYHYPQAPFPYQRLLDENAGRGREQREFELLDTGIFDEDRFFAVEVRYAKATPEDVGIEISVSNCGPAAATLHVLPTLWFRNTWSWDHSAIRPEISAEGATLHARHPRLGDRWLVGERGGEALCCDNETNLARCFGAAPQTAYPKDGINDHVVAGAATVNPEGRGTKGSLHYVLELAAGATRTIRLQLGTTAHPDLGAAMDALLVQRRQEADTFYSALAPDGTDPDTALVMRQAFAGMLWSKQFYHYDIERWLEGDPTEPVPPPGRGAVRNGDWTHFHAVDVISMPDTWEYPWFASWDLAFHCVALAHVDPAFAKRQLILLCREWYMHPNGQLPAYEWSFDDVNPPVHAWAAIQVFRIDGARDYDFLERVFHKLLINFTWWVNREDAEGNNVFQGGFLGVDNIGIFNRSAMPPGLGHLEQSDGTAWMAMYCLNLLDMALILAEHDDTYEDVATKFFEHFAYISQAMDSQGLWDDEDGYYYDQLHLEDGSRMPIKAHSIVGLIAVCGLTVLPAGTAQRVPNFIRRLEWFMANKPAYSRVISHIDSRGVGETRLLSVVDPARLRRILQRVVDPQELLSDHGLRAVSRYHRDHPLEITINGMQARLDYEPAESTTGLFGGNSNWRGPVWFPVNYLVIEALRRYHRFLGDEMRVEYPRGSGRQLTLGEIAGDLSQRLVSIFRSGTQGRRPVLGDSEVFQANPHWANLIPFHEYFDGETGRGLGASHQTGWTGLVADLIVSPTGRG